MTGIDVISNLLFKFGEIKVRDHTISQNCCTFQLIGACAIYLILSLNWKVRVTQVGKSRNSMLFLPIGSGNSIPFPNLVIIDLDRLCIYILLIHAASVVKLNKYANTH